MIFINLKENEIIKKHDCYDEIINVINYFENKFENKNGKLTEYMVGLYYRILDYEVYPIKNNDDNDNEKDNNRIREEQERWGDFIIDDELLETFTVDAKSSHIWDNTPKLGISLSHWDKNDKPYYGSDYIKKTNYSWLYYLNKCDKLACYNKYLKQLFIIEDWKTVRDTLLSEYVTEDMKPKYKNIRQLNDRLGYKALEKTKPKYDNPKYDYFDNRNILINYSTKTELLSLTLKEEVIKELGSDLTIIQFEY